MKRSDIRIIGGILLIAAGIVALLQNLGILVGVVQLLWVLLLGAAGAAFVYVFLTDRANWWAIIPGFAFLGLTATVGLDTIAPQAGATWGGVLFMGGLSLGFWVIYFLQREHWWAIIPGGVLLTVGVVVGLASVIQGIETGGIFFLGLGLTFGLLAFLPTEQGRMKWALIPAAVLLVIGVVITAATMAIFKYLWPAALILVGVYVIFRMLGPRKAE